MFHRRAGSEHKLQIPYHERASGYAPTDKLKSTKSGTYAAWKVRSIWFALLAVLAIFGLRSYRASELSYWHGGKLKGDRLWDQWPIEPGWKWNHTTDANNLLLTQTHCQQAFPQLFRELDRQVRRQSKGKIQFQAIDVPSKHDGVIRAMIYDGQLYIIDAGATVDSRSIAVLSQIYRALTTSSETVANIEFAFSVHHNEQPHSPLWTISRSHDDSTTWLMPDSGFFSGLEAGIGSFHDARRIAEAMDEIVPWTEKDSKLFWRGSEAGLDQPRALMNVTADRHWADVALMPSSGIDRFRMDEHCRAKYLANTENTPSGGRLKYLQLCDSVIISHPPGRNTHLSHLLKNDGADQNYLEVTEDDWSDLESKVRHLQQWDALGQRIAKNSIKTFRQRYLTPAAEVCYWRRLFRGWSRAIAFDPQLYVTAEDGSLKTRGVSFETFILQQRPD